MVLLIDNYDSFVYNLARYVGELGYERIVKRNDAVTLTEINELNPSHIIISPGPCTPNEAGISVIIVQHFGSRIPVLGVCLGHQAIGQAYGGKIVRALRPMHGKTSLITHDQTGLFEGIDNPIRATRYHSLVVSDRELPDDIIITARSDENEIMALRHSCHPVFGLQFHPESVLTTSGYDLLSNFLSL